MTSHHNNNNNNSNNNPKKQVAKSPRISIISIFTMETPNNVGSKKRPKGSSIRIWKPFKLVPLTDSSIQMDKKYEDLPDYSASNISTELLDDAQHNTHKKTPLDDSTNFSRKLLRDATFPAHCMLVTLEIILSTPSDDMVASASTEKQSETVHECLHEGWTHVQDRISWLDCCTLFRYVENHLHILVLPHPLDSYATKTLFQLDDSQLKGALNIFHSLRVISVSKVSNPLQLSQLVLNHVANQSPRLVGVLLENPFQTRETSSKLSSLSRSCLPTCVLELDWKDSNQRPHCTLVALYDLESDETLTVGTVNDNKCGHCFRCCYKSDSNLLDSDTSNDESLLRQAHRLAHVNFQDNNYEAAKRLYRVCHDKYEAKASGASSDEHSDYYKRQAADTWHAMGAVELAQYHFIQAQKHWKEGSHYITLNDGIALQLEKQAAYRYLEPVIKNDSSSRSEATAACPLYESYGSTKKKLFVTNNLVSSSQCQQLIQWAEDHASSRGGWTTSRHYAVPTTDVPVHQVPLLLEWFQAWMQDVGQALFRQQFDVDLSKQFHVHDAFLVRYSAPANHDINATNTSTSSASNFLPLHYDESTHSFVLALNQDFQGGGTYFYDIDKTITPYTTGSMVSFPGNKLLHGGNVVTSGVRYILAGFLYLDDALNEVSSMDNSKKSSKQSLQDTFQDAKRQKTADGFSFGFFSE
jgi:hypothetical protein